MLQISGNLKIQKGSIRERIFSVQILLFIAEIRILELEWKNQEWRVQEQKSKKKRQMWPDCVSHNLDLLFSPMSLLTGLINTYTVYLERFWTGCEYTGITRVSVQHK